MSALDGRFRHVAGGPATDTRPHMTTYVVAAIVHEPEDRRRYRIEHIEARARYAVDAARIVTQELGDRLVRIISNQAQAY